MTPHLLVQFAVDAIVRYLHAHQDSADTVEGIHEWWIEWPTVPESIFITYTALMQLEAECVMERKLVSNREIWRLAKAQDADLGAA